MQNKTISYSGKPFISSSKWYSIADFVPSQLSSIVSQPALGVELPSQAFDLASTEPPSADPRKEPILVEITDTSTTAENVSFNFDAYRGIFFSFSLLSFIWLPTAPDTSWRNTCVGSGARQSAQWSYRCWRWFCRRQHSDCWFPRPANNWWWGSYLFNLSLCSKHELKIFRSL